MWLLRIEELGVEKVLHLGKVIISVKKIFRNWVGGPELEVSGKLQANFVRYLCIRDLIC